MVCHLGAMFGPIFVPVLGIIYEPSIGLYVGIWIKDKNIFLEGFTYGTKLGFIG